MNHPSLSERPWQIEAIDIKGIFVSSLRQYLSAVYSWILKQYRSRTENRCNDQLCSWRETTARHDQVELCAFAFKYNFALEMSLSNEEMLTAEMKIGIKYEFFFKLTKIKVKRAWTKIVSNSYHTWGVVAVYFHTISSVHFRLRQSFHCIPYRNSGQ